MSDKDAYKVVTASPIKGNIVEHMDDAPGFIMEIVEPPERRDEGKCIVRWPDGSLHIYETKFLVCPRPAVTGTPLTVKLLEQKQEELAAGLGRLDYDIKTREAHLDKLRQRRLKTVQALHQNMEAMGILGKAARDGQGE